MEMRTRGDTGRPHPANSLAGFNHLSLLYLNLAQVNVNGGHPLSVVNPHSIPMQLKALSHGSDEGDSTPGRCDDGRTGWGGVIESTVVIVVGPDAVVVATYVRRRG